MKETLEELEDRMCDRIRSMPERDRLKDAEHRMMLDEECRRRIEAFQNAQNDYNFFLKSFGEQHENTKSAQKRLYEAKRTLDEHPLVREYTGLFASCNEPLRYLEFRLLFLFSRKGHSGC